MRCILTEKRGKCVSKYFVSVRRLRTSFPSGQLSLDIRSMMTSSVSSMYGDNHAHTPSCVRGAQYRIYRNPKTRRYGDCFDSTSISSCLSVGFIVYNLTRCSHMRVGRPCVPTPRVPLHIPFFLVTVCVPEIHGVHSLTSLTVFSQKASKVLICGSSSRKYISARMLLNKSMFIFIFVSSTL